MLIILSPAKIMNMASQGENIPATCPHYEIDAEFLAQKMRHYSVEELEKLLKISPTLAEENYKRYQHFNNKATPRRQAIFAYNGSVFKNINAQSFSKDDLEYAQEHLRIISTMYGLVRPLDEIKAYRLTYGLKLEGVEGKNLYDYWKSKLTQRLIEDVKNAGGILVNLASLDVLGVLSMEEIVREVKMITPEFQEYRNGKYETIRTYAKLARGAMTRCILLNKIQSPEKLKNLEWEGFRFNADISDADKYIFTRPKK